MNDPEVTMLSTRQKPNGRLVAHEVALDGATAALQIVGGTPAPLRSLAGQIVRAASSVPANLAEGAGRSGRDRLHHWRIAGGSALEVKPHVEMFMRAGAVDGEKARVVLELFDCECALTWRLLHPRP